jgi:hypothetical protein
MHGVQVFTDNNMMTGIITRDLCMIVEPANSRKPGKRVAYLYLKATFEQLLIEQNSVLAGCSGLNMFQDHHECCSCSLPRCDAAFVSLWLGNICTSLHLGHNLRSASICQWAELAACWNRCNKRCCLYCSGQWGQQRQRLVGAGGRQHSACSMGGRHTSSGGDWLRIGLHRDCLELSR